MMLQLFSVLPLWEPLESCPGELRVWDLCQILIRANWWSHIHLCQKAISLSPSPMDQAINRSKVSQATRPSRELVQGDNNYAVCRGLCSLCKKQPFNLKLECAPPVIIESPVDGADESSFCNAFCDALPAAATSKMLGWYISLPVQLSPEVA